MFASQKYRLPVIFLVLLVSMTDTAKGVKIINGCPEHFSRVSMRCTVTIMQQLPWAKAEAECKNRASLMFMTKDQATYDALLNPNPGNKSNTDAQNGAGVPPMPGNLMMGLKYTNNDKKWTWSDGTLYNPDTDWAMWISGKPPKPEKDACVVWKKKGNGMGWDAVDCGMPGMTVCYAQATSSVQTCPDRYMQEDDTCIMPVMRLDSSYNSGLADCKAAGDGIVVTVKNMEEFKRFQFSGDGMFRQLPVPIWVGLKFTAADGKWKWSDGQEYHMGSDWGLWKDGKAPETPTRDTCVTMMKTAADSFEWTLEDCNAQKGLAMCTKKAIADPSDTNTGSATVDAGPPLSVGEGRATTAGWMRPHEFDNEKLREEMKLRNDILYLTKQNLILQNRKLDLEIDQLRKQI